MTSLLQFTTGITNHDKFITNYDKYYKSRQLLQITTVHTIRRLKEDNAQILPRIFSGDIESPLKI